MNPNAPLYVVRLWYEGSGSSRVLRASLTNIQTKERHRFQRPQDLLDFLMRRELELTSD